MGVVNVTPDSFAGGVVDPAAAIDLALRLEGEGADLIDIGAESTRPGADSISAADELSRILPVLRGLAGRLQALISVDTTKPEVAEAALDAGASIINDVSGLRDGPGLAAVVGRHGALLVLMHSRGTPKTMRDFAEYGDLVGEITAELQASIRTAMPCGVVLSRIIVDPGIGFAKRPEHSYGVLARLPQLAEALERPILVGPSRKSFLREAAAGRPAVERDWVTAAAVTAAVLGGAHIVRVHAVAEMRQVVRAAEEIRRAAQP